MNIESPAHTIFLQIKVPEILLSMASGLPSCNPIPCLALAEALKANMSLDGVQIGGINGAGSIDSAIFLIVVEDVHGALRSMQSTLQRLELFDFCTIHYFCEAEAFYRPFCHGFGVNPKPFSVEQIRQEIETRARRSAEVAKEGEQALSNVRDLILNKNQKPLKPE
jgi:hypothetical protein